MFIREQVLNLITNYNSKIDSLWNSCTSDPEVASYEQGARNILEDVIDELQKIVTIELIKE